jgi:hypothetical protein
MFERNIVKFKNIFIAVLLFFMTHTAALAERASVDFSITLPEYIQIQTVSNAVLIANITDKTGNLFAPITSRFRVISNSNSTKTLYLKSEAITENGNEESMFKMGGRVYVAFANVKTKPSSQALMNCKLGSHPKESPGVVAYPINSILGAKSQFDQGLGKYKIFIEAGITNIVVNIDSHVLRNSFDSNDPRGFYQATLSLTESEI